MTKEIIESGSGVHWDDEKDKLNTNFDQLWVSKFVEQDADYTPGTLPEGYVGFSRLSGKTFFKSSTGFWTSPDWGYIAD